MTFTEEQFEALGMFIAAYIDLFTDHGDKAALVPVDAKAFIEARDKFRALVGLPKLDTNAS